jgi:hypothetical protein
MYHGTRRWPALWLACALTGQALQLGCGAHDPDELEDGELGSLELAQHCTTCQLPEHWPDGPRELPPSEPPTWFPPYIPPEPEDDCDPDSPEGCECPQEEEDDGECDEEREPDDDPSGPDQPQTEGL